MFQDNLDKLLHIQFATRYCQQEKGLVLHAWCFVSNHVHLVLSAKTMMSVKYSVILKSLPSRSSIIFTLIL
ncbi:MAG: hypothetical protein EAY75_07630 [Bacteroidetes bacterium]|nr:MAG: hypothetical protein EAY75_07630 [Bacteroidota bacterium]